MTNGTPEIPQRARTGRNTTLPLALALIAAVTVAVYWPVLANDFITYDDPDYVVANQMVRQGLTLPGILWSFSAFHAGNWHPLTWLSHMLDVQLFDLNPRGHHGVNLLLHTANSLLLCVLLHRLTGFLGRSIFVALLFAIHPLHVESVAWVAERKDLLSTLLWLLTMAVYAAHARKPSGSRYAAVIVLLALGLMAKQMLVTLPLIFLLMDYWPLHRLHPSRSDLSGVKTILLEKLPLLGICLAASVVTLRAQETAGAVAHGDRGSLLINAGNALVSYLVYIWKMLWPTDLALFYPFDPAAVTAPRVAAAVLVLSVATTFAVLQREQRPYLLFGWLWYLITLLPVIGFIRIGSHSLADRYTYIPLIGLFLALTWGGAELAAKLRKGPVLAGVAAVLAVSALAFLTVSQIRHWRNSFELYSHALAVVPGNWLAHNNMGTLLAQQYRTEEAIYHFSASARVHPAADTYKNLGNAYQMMQRNQEAITAFREAVRLRPDDPQGHLLLGYAYLGSGSRELAYQEYLELARLDEAQARSLLDSIRMSGG